MIKWTLAAVIIGFLIDLAVGDPRWLYHPIRAIGNLIALLEKILRRYFPKGRAGERTAGVILVVLTVAVSTAVPLLILYFAYRFNEWLGFVLETLMCYQLLATRALKDESMKVYDALMGGDIEKSRHAVSMIVGRDTKELTEEGVTKATVETVAENASDGVIAPLFYLMIGGAVLGFTYKSINTMDSMVGYKNERYRYFGTCAALLDDVVNYIPARLSGILMVAASAVSGFDARQAFRIFKRDRRNHASPNSAQTEAVMAGALNVQLAGDAWYFGKLYEKPTIGDAGRPVEPQDIKRSNRLLYSTAVLSVIVFGLIRFAVMRAFQI
ncbi:adenosylcobinamide-phosphate synthase CbiB [Ruminococcus gauvreauii]|uniref:adenosylcobinamide-phosphate synthase CbiB n=1 Tax=Ruminococcus gauvreauii TaxID=438033 RepID=UPI0039843958